MMPTNATQVVSFDVYYLYQDLFPAKANAGDTTPANSTEGSDSESKEPRLSSSSLLDRLRGLLWIMLGPMLLCVTLIN